MDVNKMVRIDVYRETSRGYVDFVGSRVADDFEIKTVRCADCVMREQLVLIHDTRRYDSFFLGRTTVGTLWYCVVKDYDGNVIYDFKTDNKRFKVEHDGLWEFDEYGNEIDAI